MVFFHWNHMKNCKFPPNPLWIQKTSRRLPPEPPLPLTANGGEGGSAGGLPGPVMHRAGPCTPLSAKQRIGFLRGRSFCPLPYPLPNRPLLRNAIVRKNVKRT